MAANWEAKDLSDNGLSLRTSSGTTSVLVAELSVSTQARCCQAAASQLSSIWGQRCIIFTAWNCVYRASQHLFKISEVSSCADNSFVLIGCSAEDSNGLEGTRGGTFTLLLIVREYLEHSSKIGLFGLWFKLQNMNKYSPLGNHVMQFLFRIYCVYFRNNNAVLHYGISRTVCTLCDVYAGIVSLCGVFAFQH